MCVRIQTIELDCAPGAIRPGDLISAVVEGTPLAALPEAQPDASISRVFGNWTWSFPNTDAEVWEHIARTGSSPTRSEIAQAMGYRSANAAEEMVRRLARKGVLELTPGVSRGIKVRLLGAAGIRADAEAAV
jgi:hypothetical protein